VVHSLGNAVSAIALAGAYYQSTGDQEFFRQHPAIYEYGKRVLQEIHRSAHGHEFLFPSMYISDGDARGDYHTGSNLIVWYAFKVMARLGEEIYGDDAASEWGEVAHRIRQALYERCVGQGPLGPQLYEGAYRDGRFVPGHDGEESDLTLAPFYGFCDADEPTLLRHAQLALSELNPYYVPALEGVSCWDERWFGPTFPAYVHALAGASSESDIEAALERIRWRTDLDGSIWWWPHEHDWTDYAHVKRGPGKCGWAAGVYVVRFIHDIIGLDIDVPARTLRFRPFCPWPQFRWEGLRLGTARLDLEYRRSATAMSAAMTNRTTETFTTSAIELTLPGHVVPVRSLINGEDGQEIIRVKQRYERTSIIVSRPLQANETLHLQVEWRDTR
jgi:hypothetical protein